MKKYISLFLFCIVIISCKEDISIRKPASGFLQIQMVDSMDLTNNFYDNVETFSLPLNDLSIDGEISNPGIVDVNKLTKRSVIVKEAILDEAGGNKFTGAFRYDGYSLTDILDNIKIRKTNAEEFQSVIDLYVEIENASGEKAVFSWGEIYYPNNLYKIILASDVARIVPSKTKDLWVLPETSKLVCGNDLVTERNIKAPTKITVRSYPKSFKTVKGMSPMFSEGFSVFTNNKESAKVNEFESGLNLSTYNTVFYGRGRGIHSTTPFKGVFLKSMIEKYFPFTKENVMTGLFCFAGKDGYRMTVSFSELFNRNDQQEFLLVKTAPDEDGGLFRVFPSCDFFSDRAIKSLSEVHFIK
jgi:hypothetical protein